MGWTLRQLLGVALVLVVGAPTRADTDLHPVVGCARRVWTDNSGSHRVAGQLVAIGRDRVRLLRSDQQYCTVPLHRLSSADVVYLSSVLRMGAAADKLSRKHLVARTIQPATPNPLAPAESVDLIHIRVASDFLARLTQDYDSSRRVNDQILGTPVYGTARTVADVELTTREDTERAVLLIPVKGTVTTRSTSDAGIVQVHSRGITEFDKTLQVVITDQGLDVQPVSLDASTNYDITGFSTSVRCCLIRKVVLNVASRRAAESYPEASRVAAIRERKRLDRSINLFAENAFAPMNRGFRKVFDTLGSVEESRRLTPRFASSSDAVHVTVSAPPSSTTVPPPPAMPSSPFVVQVHNSVIDDIFEMIGRVDQGTEDEPAPLADLLKQGNGVWVPMGTWWTLVWTPDQVDELAQN